MERNCTEDALKRLYDDWDFGNRMENNPHYSSMFRMGFPDEYVDSGKPLLMYVGQECLGCEPFKTQEWVREYQRVQSLNIRNTSERFRFGTNRSPFWNVYRRLCRMGYDVLWNNLNKFHPIDSQQLSLEDGVACNAAYGKEGLSILQREIRLLKPAAVVLVIGNGKYTAALASAFSINKATLQPYEPNNQRHVSDISDVLGLDNTRILWTYHPTHLQYCGIYPATVSQIEQRLR